MSLVQPAYTKEQLSRFTPARLAVLAGFPSGLEDFYDTEIEAWSDIYGEQASEMRYNQIRPPSFKEYLIRMCPTISK